MSAPVPDEERELVRRVLLAVLREDVGGVRSRGRLVAPVLGEHWWLVRGRLRIPVAPPEVERGDLLTDLAVRVPMVVLGRHLGRQSEIGRLDGVLAALAAELPTGLPAAEGDELRAGLTYLRAEAGAALAAARLRRERRPAALATLGLKPGWAGALDHEVLAAHRDHPFYPTSLARLGVPVASLPAIAPEHAPQLQVRWFDLPASAVSSGGRLPEWWPVAQGVALPVHPALPAAVLGSAFGAARELEPMAARPTLSLRTVALFDRPAEQLKLPLPISTLGRLNVRGLTRPGLADGALVGELLREVRGADSRLASSLIVADESTWLHAGDPMLAVLLRRWDPGGEQHLDLATIVPVAGLAATAQDGRPVLAGLADRYAGGDCRALIEAYVRLVLDVQVTLWLQYGIALEAHPQNVLLALDPLADGGFRLRLLVRDLDSARLDPDLLAASLPSRGAGDLRAAAGDARLLTGDPRELADLFATTTLHQCVAAVLVDAAAGLGLPLRPLLAGARARLAEAADRHPGARDGPLLRARILDARRLVVKRALTAATLLPKSRTGAADVNKYYGADAPSYLTD